MRIGCGAGLFRLGESRRSHSRSTTISVSLKLIQYSRSRFAETKNDTVDGPRDVVASTMNNEKATSDQYLQLVAKFAQTLPTDADRSEVQKAIENKDDSLWVALAARFAKKPIVQKPVEAVRDDAHRGLNFRGFSVVWNDQPGFFGFRS